MKTSRGGFVVLEGLDGSGTTTQAHLLDRHLRDRGIRTVLTREPTDHAIGRLIRAALSGQPVSEGGLGEIALSEEALCLLFAADRIEHTRDIETFRERGDYVVCDRYILSSIAYQSLDPLIAPERVVEVNRGIAVPDITFLLDVPVDECLKRLEKRNDSPTIYERKDKLVAIAANYEASLSLYQDHYGSLIRIDGTKPPDAVHAAILGHLGPQLEG